MFDIEEITNKWGELGFLEQLSEHLKPIIALKYELTAHYLIGNGDYLNDTMLQNVIFPIIYRIYKQGKTISNVETFVRQVHVFFINNREAMQDLTAFSNIDMEAEMCALFVEQYKSENTIEPIKWINKHKFVKNEKPNNEEVWDPVSEPTDDTVINWWDRLKHFFCNLIKK
mgnify:CR=1 FL=1|tara:strand:- start:20245 stop:20757 length:513 start_codon:yes stop_codon:yes gene_type:complete